MTASSRALQRGSAGRSSATRGATSGLRAAFDRAAVSRAWLRVGGWAPLFR
jgi:hypothetical protein